VLAGDAALAAPVCEAYAGVPTGNGATAGMIWIDGGSFTIGDNRTYPEERPTEQVRVSGFWIDRHEVTNAQFRRFVEATGYVTMAERGLDPTEHPGLPAELAVPSSMMFAKPERVRGGTDITQWWRYLPGADWRHPEGPGSSSEGRGNHPVVHVAYEDATAYARWLGHDLPTEAEWEFAARGGLDGAIYTWGDSYDPVEGWRANTWQGSFPVRDDAADGYSGAAPVGCFPPNGYGLLDMAGNVWEYTRDRFVAGHSSRRAADPIGPDARPSGPAGPSVVVKGGSWLCSPDFCLRYRPAARQPQELSLGSNHIGFRTVWRGPAPEADR
jgi:formylglycine-generating enzyme required for sulfatase activity